MTTPTSLVNLALQSFGSRTTVTDAELAGNLTNEAIQANLTFANTRDSLLRMAPWDCALKTANLTYITSVPGTPENTSPATNLWQPGQPRPPWAYEYQYPVDCLRACWIIPSSQTGFAGGVPITTAVTGGASTTWLGGPIPFKVGIDQFYPIINAVIVNGGLGYAPQDIITAASGPTTSPPLGAPVQLFVTAIGAGGAVTNIAIVAQIPDETIPAGGSYFTVPGIQSVTTQGSTTGSGSGIIFNLISGFQGDQRVILTNQEFATLCYVRQVTDPNIWDPLFQDAFQNALGADLCIALSGDKALANICIARANNSITEARKADGNEGLTINDVTPDWIRTRGVCWTDTMTNGPYSGYNWGGLLSGWA